MFLSLTLIFRKMNQDDVVEVRNIQELEDRMEDLEVEHDLVLDSRVGENSLSGPVHQKELCDELLCSW